MEIVGTRICLFILVGVCATSLASAGPVHDAARRGELMRVKDLLAEDETLVDAVDQSGHTPLALAAAYARWDVFRFLLGEGADAAAVNQKTSATALHAVCYHDVPAMVELLFKHGGAANLTVADVFGGYTPLLRAVQSGAGDVAVFLLRNGARVDELTREGWNALHLAAICGHRHLYGPLIREGVSLDALDRVGRTPMCYDRARPKPIEAEVGSLKDYVGRYHWEGDEKNPGVDVFIRDALLVLDDNGLNIMDPIAPDTFYCRGNPWTVTFMRADDGEVVCVELVFLRQTVVLDRM
jgi:hypothetical protein